MTIEFSCLICRRKIQASEAQAGGTMRCPFCQMTNTVPAVGGDAASSGATPDEPSSGGSLSQSPWSTPNPVSLGSSASPWPEQESPAQDLPTQNLPAQNLPAQNLPTQYVPGQDLPGQETSPLDSPSPSHFDDATYRLAPQEEPRTFGAPRFPGGGFGQSSGFPGSPSQSGPSPFAPPNFGSSPGGAGPWAPGQPGQNPYASPITPSHGWGGYLPQGMSQHRGNTIKTLGITGLAMAAFGILCLGPILEPVAFGLSLTAIFMARTDLRKIDQGQMDPYGRSDTKTGMVTGMVGAGLSTLMLLVYVAYFIFIIVAITQQRP